MLGIDKGSDTTRSLAFGNGVKGQAAILHSNAADKPQLFAESFHIVPHLDGTVAVGSTSEREFDTPDTTDQHLDDMLHRVCELMPVLHGARVIERDWPGHVAQKEFAIRQAQHDWAPAPACESSKRQKD